MEMSILVGLSGASFLLLIANLVLMLRARRSATDGLREELQTLLSRSSMQLSGELSGTIVRSTGDIRQDLTDRLNEKFHVIGRELKEDQKTGRDEVRDGLLRTTASLEAKFNVLESKVNERLEIIGREVQTRLDKNLQDGFAHFQKVQETLAGAEKQLSNLNAVGQSIQELNNVLNLPHLRGKIIGEGNLERMLADFLPADYFEMQYAIEGALVDAVVKFPHLNLVLPIDSKFSLEQVAPLFDHASTPDALKNARKKLSDVVKQNAKDIKNKYIKPKLGTTDYALMYLPAETLYFEIIRDTDLWGMLVDLKVFPVSPNTLAITINSIGKSLKYYEMAKDVKKTIEQIHVAREHLNRFKARFDDIGEKLTKAQESYQKANTHFSHYSSSVDRLEPPVEVPLADSASAKKPLELSSPIAE